MNTTVAPQALLLDHAWLAQALSREVDSLENAWWEHERVATTADSLGSFVDEVVAPYLQAEEVALYAGAGRVQFAAPPQRILQRRLRVREHSRILETAADLRRLPTGHRTVTVARQLRSLFEQHIAREDRALARADVRLPAGEAKPTELDRFVMDAVAAAHARISRQLDWAAHEGALEPAGLPAAAEHVIGSLCQHYALMARHVYPLAGREATRQLRSGMRSSEHAMLSLERILHGNALERREHFDRAWDAVVAAHHRHVAVEEPLVEQLAHRLSTEQTVRLLGSLRAGASRTAAGRPHPASPLFGAAGALAAVVNQRLDRVRDALDNRSA
jgi:hypothetical protein